MDLNSGMFGEMASAMPVRALLFDKDGTLVDIQATLGPATCDVLAHLERRRCRRCSAGSPR